MDQEKQIYDTPRVLFIVPRTENDGTRVFKDPVISNNMLGYIDHFFAELIELYGIPDLVISSPHVAQEQFSLVFSRYAEEKGYKDTKIFYDPFIRHRYMSDIETENAPQGLKERYDLFGECDFLSKTPYNIYKPKIAPESYTSAFERIKIFCDNLFKINNYERSIEAGMPNYVGKVIWVVTHPFVTFISSKYLFKFNQEGYYVNCTNENTIGYMIDYNYPDGEKLQEFGYKPEPRNNNKYYKSERKQNDNENRHNKKFYPKKNKNR